jgi:hypothetical protein
MLRQNTQDKNQYLYPRGSYHGKFTPEKLVFNANLQEFSQRVGYISALETGGKLTTEEAYQSVKALWKDLKNSYQQIDSDLS